ncbi:uncharacterized protein LOC115884268 [Sitophilus oryzae]|uniref:Germinal-center associated nuclear protein n=1 Tax=Sitophilus oryzae TaxID=7048 RepID=A0A6J2Y6F1_SITOR|nr:uncharacterized protein LOC115884268 [Sitophilus oryzae]
MENPDTEASENLRIACYNYPEEFEINKRLCKTYFRQFGKVKRLIFKQRQRAIVVEYINRDDYLNALENIGEYRGQIFHKEPYESTTSQLPIQPQVVKPKKKIRERVVKKHKISYVDHDEVDKELAAMSGYSNVNVVIDLTSDSPKPTAKPKILPKLNRVWKKEDARPTEALRNIATKKRLLKTAIKNKVKESVKILTAEQLDLLKIMRSQANTIEEKYKVLDARDKLLRFNRKKSVMKSGPTIGTCCDMCPEKERLLREVKHQVAFYEQNDGVKHSMNHHKAVKQYSRSSADQESPLPHDLRPVKVLQFTMNYLVYTFMDLCDTDSEVNIAEWYHFLWDRTRGIRKDITQQALCSQGAVELVEQCTRFHIHCAARLTSEDPSVFDHKINDENLTKCLQTLKYMYNDLHLKGEKCSNEAEFRAYVILLNLSDGNFMWEVQKLPEDIQKSPEIRFALQVYSAADTHNYVKFFKLIKSTTYLNACILMRYFVQVRVQALETLLKCFTPPRSISFYPLEEFVNLLYFDDVEAAIDFLNSYGISVNKSRNQVLFERSAFKVPEYQYVLDRSGLVESKRQGSVGSIISGKEMSPELYLEMQSHELHDSFDKNGFLIKDELFNEVEMRIEEKLLDEPDSRESTPERKNVTSIPVTKKTTISRPQTNIFETKSKTEPDSIFDQDTSPFVSQNEFSVFGQNKIEPDNIFAQKKENIFATNLKKEENIFKNKDENIFQIKKDTSEIQAKENIFKSVTTTSSDPIVNIFKVQPSVKEETNIFTASNLSKPPDVKIPAIEPTPNIFAEKVTQPPKTETKMGGFQFNLKPQKTSEVPNIFALRFKTTPPQIEDNKTKMIDPKPDENATQLKEEESELDEDEETEMDEDLERMEDERRRKEEEENQRKIEEEQIRRRLEVERRKREEEERRMREEKRRIAEEKRILEEERKRKERELERQKEIEEKQRQMEIKRSVKLVLKELIDQVDQGIKDAALNRIKTNIRNRIVLKVFRKWRTIVLRRKKKRKAMDCIPIWVNDKDVSQCAKDFYSKTQDLTLSYMKRYKLGRPLDIPVVEDQPTVKLNLFYLTYSALRRRLCEIKEKWHQHIYWKVVISIPDVDEMINGLHKLEETLKSYAGWELTKHGTTQYIENHKTVTYCVEKQQGLDVRSSDANGFVFVGKNFNPLFQRRIVENLKNFGVYVKVPVIIILEDTSNSEEYLEKLQETGVVSDYVIYSCNLYGQVLPSVIDNGFIFLAKKIEKYPPLEMDTLYTFLMRNLCTEIWKKAESYAKWNHEYNFCMRDPNILINLYNEGLQLLTKIVMDSKRKEFAPFPEVFRDHLPDKVPDFLPCDYRYFPNFWTHPSYEDHLQRLMKSLKLPKFLENWPPHNETDLILAVSKYCTEVFQNPKEPYVNILDVLIQTIRDERYDTILWTQAIEIIATEKLKEQDFDLPKKFMYEDVFRTFVVVYDVESLNEYSTSEWFYRNNPLIEGYKKTIEEKLEKDYLHDTFSKTKKRSLEVIEDEEDFLEVINKAEQVLRSPKSMRLEHKKSIECLNRSIKDLEESIGVVKRMDEMKLFKRFMEG